MKKNLEKNIYFKDFAPFSFKKIGKSYLLVNEWGDYLLLSNKEFSEIENFKYDNGELHKKLHLNNFLVEDLNVDSLVKDYREKNKDLLFGSSYFDVYIDKLLNGNNKEKTIKIFDEILSKIFLTSSKNATIKLRGDELLLNLDLVKNFINNAFKKSKEYKKELNVEIYTDFYSITDALLKLIDELDIALILVFRASASTTEKETIKKVNTYYEKAKNINKKRNVKSSVIINKKSIKYFKEIVDANVNAGFKKISYRILNKYEVNEKDWEKDGFSNQDLIGFYKNLLDYLIILNKKGVSIKDNITEIFLRKINKLNIENRKFSSPCAAGISRLTFSENGDIYLCNNAFRLFKNGDDSFKIGNINDITFSDIANNKVLKTACIASCNEALPGCSTCIYRPYCGPCPVNNHYEHDDPFKQEYGKSRCGFVINALDSIFKHIEEGKNKKIFSEWVK